MKKNNLEGICKLKRAFLYLQFIICIILRIIRLFQDFETLINYLQQTVLMLKVLRP